MLYIFPPQWYPMNPFLSVATLTGQLRKNGYDARILDLNVEFFCDIFTKEYLQSAVDDAMAFLKEYTPLGLSKEEIMKADYETATLEARYILINEFFEKNGNYIKEVIDGIGDAVRVMRDSTDFYDPEKLFKAKDILSFAARLASLPTLPCELTIDNYYPNPLFPLDYNHVKSQCFDKRSNIFIDYFEKKLETLDLSEYDYIGISIPDISQLVAGLTLSRLLKNKTSAHISIGGGYISKISEEFKKYPEMFEIFFDSAEILDGENNCIEMAEYISGKRNIKDVHSLVYSDGNTVIYNKLSEKLDMDSILPPDFTGIDFSRYFSPSPVIPLQISKGCYWGKCTFCDFYTGQQCFDIKSVDTVIAEIEEMIHKYSANTFLFVDEAVPPAFYKRLAERIIEKNLKIYFYSFARLEKSFAKELLELLYKAGARLFMWGYESASERIMEMINKGVDLDERLDIMKASADVGIWNHVTFLLGYPTETIEEMKLTEDVIVNRGDVVDSLSPSSFAMKRCAAIANGKPEEFGITDYNLRGEFHVSYEIKTVGIQMQELKKHKLQFQSDYIYSKRHKLWNISFSDSDHLLLYIIKYGKEFVKNYTLEYERRI